MRQLSQEDTLGIRATTIKKVIKAIDLALRKGFYTTPYMILGPVGTGKTTAIREYAKNNGLGFMELRLASYMETDLAGLPKIVKRETKHDFTPEEVEQGKDYVVKWVQSGILPNELDPNFKEKGILFLDEITNANPGVQAAAWQLMDSSRGVGAYKLPEKWLVVAAGNGPADGGNFTTLSSAILGRCMKSRINPDAAEWVEWAQGHDLDPTIRAFVTTNPDQLWGGDATLDQIRDGCAFPQPRTWGLADVYLKGALEDNNGEDLDFETVEDYVGQACGDTTGTKFAAFYILRKQMLKMSDIEEGRIQLTPDKITSMRTEILSIQSEEIVSAVCKKMLQSELGKGTEEEKKELVRKGINIFKFIVDMANIRLDLSITCIRMIRSFFLNYDRKDEGFEPEDVHGVFLKFLFARRAELTAVCPGWTAFQRENQSAFELV